MGLIHEIDYGTPASKSEKTVTLTIDGREIEMRLDKAVPVDETSAKLERVLDHRLA